MNYRAILGRDLTSSLESDYHEMPIDRIGAFSRGSRLGTLLWRLKFSHDSSAYKPATLLLAKRESLQSAVGLRLVEMALNEWLLPQCSTCNGARELIVGPRRIICDDCDGYGIRRFTDRERDRFMGCKFRKWARKYNKVWASLTGDDKGINPVMDWQLEKT